MCTTWCVRLLYWTLFVEFCSIFTTRICWLLPKHILKKTKLRTANSRCSKKLYICFSLTYSFNFCIQSLKYKWLLQLTDRCAQMLLVRKMGPFYNLSMTNRHTHYIHKLMVLWISTNQLKWMLCLFWTSFLVCVSVCVFYSSFSVHIILTFFHTTSISISFFILNCHR